MRKNIILSAGLVIIAVVAVLLTVFNRNDQNVTVKNIDIYFLNETCSSIVTENRNIKYNSKDELLNSTIESLLKGPSERKNKAIAGKNTKLLGINFTETNLTVNLSKEFLREDTTTNMLSAYAVIRTLCQLDMVTAVLVTVEGNPVIASDGTPIGFMSNRDINLETDTYTTDSKNIVLYFATKDGKSLAKEVRTIKITDTRPIESYIISELIKGPVNKDLASTLTTDTELISAETTSGTCHVTFKNFIDKNLSDPNSEKSMLAVYSVVNSLTAMENVSAVRFLFEGKITEMVGPFNFSEVFTQNDTIIK